MTTKRFLQGAALLAVATSLAACETRLDTRTFPIQHLEVYEVMPLIEPYVYGEREGAPGTATSMADALTVRETRDNLDRIAEVLARYDVPRPDFRLHFTLIEAGDFTASEAGISAVEAELREIFTFRGYREAGVGTVTVTGRSEFLQGLRSSTGMYELRGHVYRSGEDAVRLDEVSLTSIDGWTLETSVNVRAGQTLVLGSQPISETDRTLFLTVRAETVAPAGSDE